MPNVGFTLWAAQMYNDNEECAETSEMLAASSFVGTDAKTCVLFYSGSNEEKHTLINKEDADGGYELSGSISPADGLFSIHGFLNPANENQAG